MSTIRNIVMYGDVGFDLTHKHCIDFENESQRDSYFDNLTDKTFFENCNYNKTDKTLNLEVPWTEGLRFTYCSFLFDDKRMFYFVTGSHVVNDRVTGFELQLDVWQTFLFDFRVSEGMVVREHVDRWDRDGNILWRKSVDEDKISVYTRTIAQDIKPKRILHEDWESGVDVFLSAVFINYIRSGAYETVMVPVFTLDLKSRTSAGYIYGRADLVIDGSRRTIDLLDISDIQGGFALSRMGINPDSVLSISYVPVTKVELGAFTTVSHDVYGGFHRVLITLSDSGSDLFEGYAQRVSSGVQSLYFVKRYESHYSPVLLGITTVKIDFTKPTKPNDGDFYGKEHEPELFKSPYIVRSLLDVDGSLVSELPDVVWYDERKMVYYEMNDNDGVSIAYLIPKSEQIHGLNDYTLNFRDIEELASMGLSFRMLGTSMDIPTDKWLSYVLTSRDTDREMLQSTINQQGITSAIGAITGMGGISGMAGSGKSGGIGFNPYQAIVGGAIGGIMSGANYLTNNQFGWEQQSIREKAIKNEPNNLLRSATGDGLLKNLAMRQSYSEQFCNDNSFNQAADRYHKYGYLVNMVTIPNIRTRKHFNFVETSQIRIEGALNQAIKDGIADIFNNGVTIWHGENITKDNSGKLVLDYSKENIERSLL